MNELTLALSVAAFLISLAAILREPNWHYDGEWRAECPSNLDGPRCESCYELKQSPSPDCNDPKQHIGNAESTEKNPKNLEKRIKCSK